MSEELCHAVVARLKSKLPGLSAEYFPDSPERYPWAGKDKTLLVGYEGSTFGEVQSLAPQSCDEAVDLSVTVLVRSLRGPFGVSQVLAQVRRALFGWRPIKSVVTPSGGGPVTTIEPIGFRPIVPLAVKYAGEDQGSWRYVHTFRASTVAVADVEDPDFVGPPLISASFKEPD